MNNKETYYMQKAINLALKALGQTSPNPLVGAVVVKNNRIVGSGFHKKAGQPHAEIIALDKAKDKARGATLYINLEPCTHYGRTPPCVDKIIQAGIKRVVIGMIDPNPVNNGNGVRILKRNGIRVSVGVLEEKSREINNFFIKYITKGMPYVTVKVGQSLDGRIATSRFQSKWITCEESREYSHKMRKNYDAILLGINTIIRDNPLLSSDDKTKDRPIKVVVDSSLRIPIDARILSGDSNTPVIIASIRFRLKELEGLKDKIKDFREKNITILELKDKAGRVDLRQLMRKLAKLGIANILVEGGGDLIGSMFDAKLVDRIMFFVAPKIIGGKSAVSSVEGKGSDLIYQALRIKNIVLKRIGEDFLFVGDVE